MTLPLPRMRAAIAVILVLLLTGVTSASSASDKPAPSPTLVWITAGSPAERTALVSLGIDVVDAGPGGLAAWVTPDQLAQIEEAGYHWEALADALTLIPVDPAYRDYHQVTAYLQEVASNYPEITRLIVAGHSLEGRPIHALKISARPESDDERPAVLIFARTHAREHLSTEMALYTIDFITEDYGRDAAITNLVNQRQIWVLPDINPDGSLYDVAAGYYQFWRKNRRPNAGGSYGVDLNRNFGYKWGCCSGSSDIPSRLDYRGEGPFSEPETAFLQDFVADLPQISASISLHTYSELILWPYGYTFDSLPADMDPLDYQAFVTIGTQMARLNGYTPMQSSGLYRTDGSSDDWLYGAHGIFAFTFELFPIDHQIGFYPPGEVIARETQRNRSAIEYFLAIADYPRKTIGAGGDTTSPWVTILAPMGGQEYKECVQIVVDAGDDQAVTLVEIMAHHETAALLEEPPFEIEWCEGPPAGVVELRARAFDASHNIGASEVITITRLPAAIRYMPLALRAGGSD